MSRTDIIADAFTMVRNAIMAGKDSVDIPATNILKEIFEILKRESYIDNYKPLELGKRQILRVYLRYVAGNSAIRNIQRISTCSVRRYVNHKKLPQVLRGRGLAIISTSKGIITDAQARELGVGGEVIAYVW